MAQVDLEDLTEYEARALLMFIQVQNDGALFHSAEKISVQPRATGTETYALAINSPADFPADLFEKELSGVRTLRHSLLDPERERVNTTRHVLPTLNI